jgi:N-acetylglucosamine-6-phosphate deacetylase
MNNQITSSLQLSCARIIQPEDELSGTVRIENGRIAEIRDGGEKVGDLIELKGLTLFPGFIDMHIHGAKDIDTVDASDGDLQIISEFLATQGVTAWLPTVVPAAPEEYEHAIQAIDQASAQQRNRVDKEVNRAAEAEIRDRCPPGARILGVHYEGPFVNESQCGALRPEYFRAFSSSTDLEALPVPRNQHAVKMMTLAPEISGGVELVAELTQRRWVASLGHTRADVDTLHRAWAAGANHLTHFMNAMPPLHHRSPGPVGWAMLHKEVTCDVIADGIHLDPLMLALLLQVKGARRLSLISDSIAAAGMGDGEYRIWGETISVKEGRTTNERGSIAGSVISMSDAVRLMRAVGASNIEVALMAATNPARVLRIDSECGSIEVGKRADLVALDDLGDVKLTIVGGEIAFSAL